LEQKEYPEYEAGNVKFEIAGRKRNFEFQIANFKLSVLALVFLLSSCVGVPVRQEKTPPVADANRIIANARHYRKTRPDWKVDCSHFVMACAPSEKLEAFLRTQSDPRLTRNIYRFLRKEGRERKSPSGIRPGDILFFHYTYDANGDGAIDASDVYTHSGIAESYVDGTLTYIDASKGRKPPRIRRRSFSFKEGGKNERVATDPKTGREIRHRDTYHAAFGMF